MPYHLGRRLFGDNAAWRPLLGGSINTVWRVEQPGKDPVIIRVAPSMETVAQGPSWLRGDALASEMIVLDRVRPLLRVVPVPVAAGFLPDERPWVVQETVPGSLFANVMDRLSDLDRASTWRQVGEVVRRVQDVPVRWFGTPTEHQRFPDWPSMVMADVEGLRVDADRFRLPAAPFRALHELVAASVDLLAEVTKPGLVHSDLDPRHVFVHEAEGDWKVSGIIDWEYARYVDPMSESVVVEMLARPENDPDRAALLDGYGITQEELGDSAFWQRQRIYRGIAHSWAVTDAARCGGQARLDSALASFQRWLTDHRED